MKTYTSPYEIGIGDNVNYNFMNLMQNDNTEGKGATYAKLEILYAQNVTKKQVKNIKGSLL